MFASLSVDIIFVLWSLSCNMILIFGSIPSVTCQTFRKYLLNVKVQTNQFVFTDLFMFVSSAAGFTFLFAMSKANRSDNHVICIILLIGE